MLRKQVILSTVQKLACSGGVARCKAWSLTCTQAVGWNGLWWPLAHEFATCFVLSAL